MLKKIFSSLVALGLLTALAGCSGNAAESSSQGNEDATQQTQEANSASQGTANAADEAAVLTAADIAEGIYDIDVQSSSNMFNIVKAELTVANGAMSCVLTLHGTGYGYVYMGTSEEAAAAAQSDWIPYVEDAEGKYTYTVPVETLNNELDCAAWSIKKEKWYDRTLIFESTNIPADAILA